jgi:tetratricopeptide (TPR) repeat protein
VDAEPAAVDEILRCCAGLPLALGIVAARAATRPDLPLATLAAELSDDTIRLDALDSDELPASLRVVFEASYKALDADTARTFRLLGLIPGPDIGAPAAAALTALAAAQARALLRRLTAAHLVEEHLPARYRMHDLIRLYAVECAERTDPIADRRAAVTRLFNYYAHAACVAMDHFAPNESYRRPSVVVGVRPAPEFTGIEHARGWLDSERPNLLATAVYAAAHGWPDHARRLSTTLHRYLDVGAHYHDALALHTTALTAAPQDQLSHGYVLYCLGGTLTRLGRSEEALNCHEQALRQARTHHDPVLEIFAAGGLGWVCERRRHNDQALKHYEHALAVARAARHRHCEAIALTNLGDFYGLLGRYDTAADHLHQSLAIARELDDIALSSTALANLGAVYGFLGKHSAAIDHLRHALTVARTAGNRTLQLEVHLDLGKIALSADSSSEALDYYQQALTFAREIGTRLEQARAHQGLARAYHNLNHPKKTRHHLNEALTIYTELNAPEVADVHQLLEPS